MKPILKKITKLFCTAFAGLLFAAGAAAQAGHTVSGHVQDQYYNAISNLTITAFYDGGPTSAITDGSGNYTMTLPDGISSVTLEPGSLPPNATIEPPSIQRNLTGNAVQDFTLNITAQPSGYTISGTIQDVSSNTVSGVTVKLRIDGTEYTAETTNGYYEIFFPAEANNATCTIVPVPANPSVHYEPAQVEVTLTQSQSANFTQHVWPSAGSPKWEFAPAANNASNMTVPSISVDGAGNPHLAYIDTNGQMNYMIYSGSTPALTFWDSSDANTADYTYQQIRNADVSAYGGYAHVVYRKPNASTPKIHLYNNENSQSVIIGQAGPMADVSLKVNSLGKFALFRGEFLTLWVNGSTVAVAADVQCGRKSALAVDSSGTAHIMYSCTVSTDTQLFYVTVPFGGSPSTPHQVASYSNIDSYNLYSFDSVSIALKYDGTPFAVYTIFDEIQWQRSLYAFVPSAMASYDLNAYIHSFDSNAVAFFQQDKMGVLFTATPEGDDASYMMYRLYSSVQDFSSDTYEQIKMGETTAHAVAFTNDNGRYFARLNIQGELSAGRELPAYPLFGHVLQSGSPLAGVWVKVSNSVSTFTVQTDSEGFYRVASLEPDNYTVVPFMDGKTFPSAPALVNLSTGTQQDFTGYDASSETFSIYGQISGDIAGGVSVAAMVGEVTLSTITGSDGMYTLSGVPAGECVVVPALAGYTFSPASAAFTHSYNRGGVSFTASVSSSQTYSVTGRVIDGSNNGLSGVAITFSNGQLNYSTNTTTNGDYYFPAIAYGSYSITPVKDGYTFSPASATVTVDSNITLGNQFTAMVSSGGDSGTITGVITVSTGGYAVGVVVAAYSDFTNSTTTVNTDYMGRYSFSVPRGQTYSITPATGSYTFSPTHQPVPLTADATDVNFVAAPVQSNTYYTVSGHVLDISSAGLSGIDVFIADGVHFASVTSDGSGHYSFVFIPTGTYVLHAASGGYEFSPASATVVVSSANISNVNFVRQVLSSPLYTLSGTITNDTVGLSGVEVFATDGIHSETAMTGSDGVYSFTDFAVGTYVILPYLSGYVFDPASATVAVTTNTANVDFEAAEITVVIAASVTAVNQPYAYVYDQNPIFNMSLSANGEAHVSSITIGFAEPGISYADVQSVTVYEGATQISSVSNSASGAYYNQRQITVPVSLTITHQTRYLTVKVQYRDSALGKSIYPQLQNVYADAEVIGATLPVAGTPARLGYRISAASSYGYSTNIYLNAGQSALIVASGSWNISASTAVGPDGLSGSVCGNGCPMPEYPRGMLLAKFGYSSTNYYPVGSSNTVTMPWGAVSNSIYMLVNDDNYGDNSGSLFVVPSVVARQILWTGAGLTESASDSANWAGSVTPSNGDAVVFSTVSSKSCQWDIYSKPQSITLDNYAGTLKVSGYASLQTESLYVNRSSILASGTSSGGKPSFSVGTLTSIQSALTFDNASSINSDGFSVSGGTVIIRGANYTTVGGANGHPVQFTMARINISSVMFVNGGMVELNTPEISAFDNIIVERSIVSATPMVRLVQLSGQNIFRNWVFRNYSESTPYNVVSTSSVSGAQSVFLNASGNYMGSVRSLNMDGALRWEPDGGGTASLAVRAEYVTASTPTYHFGVYSSTGGLVASVITAAGISTPTFGGLTAPATYYISAAADINSDAVIDGYEPKGKQSVWVAAASSSTAVVTLMDFGKLSGTVTSPTQQGTLIGQAYQGGSVAAHEDLTYISGTSPYSWEMYLPVGTYDVRTFVDMQANGQYDSFEAGHLFEGVDVTKGYENSLSETVLAVENTTDSVVSVYMNYNSDKTINANGGSVTLFEAVASAGEGSVAVSSFTFSAAGDYYASGTYLVSIIRDSNRDGVCGAGDVYLSSAVSNGSTAPVTVAFSPVTISTAQPERFCFVMAAISQLERNRTVGIYLPASGMGVWGGHAQFSTGSGIVSTATVKFNVQASASVGYGTGGVNTGLYVEPGMTVNIWAAGTWYYNGAAAGPDGIAKYGGILPSAPEGSLIGRIGSSPWFVVGSSITFKYTQSYFGNLYLAMNKYSADTTMNNSGSIEADFSAQSAVTGVSGTISYAGQQSAPVYIKAIAASNGAVLASTSIYITGEGDYSYSLFGISTGTSLNVKAFWDMSSSTACGNARETIWLYSGDIRAGQNFAIFDGYGSLPLFVEYSGSYGDKLVAHFLVGSSEFEQSVTAGSQTLTVPAPGIYRVAVFEDRDGNGEPEGLDAMGMYGFDGPVAQFDSMGGMVEVSSGAVAAPIAITVVQKGAINGTARVCGLSGRFEFVAGHGLPGTAGYAPENGDDMWIDNSNTSGCQSVYFDIGMLRSAADYSLFMYNDVNKNSVYDEGEKFTLLAGPIEVKAGMVVSRDIAMDAAVSVPAAPANLAAVAVTTGAVVWTWSPVFGANGYMLYFDNASSVTISTTAYIENLGTPNTRAHLAGVAAINSAGVGEMQNMPAAVYTRAMPVTVEIASANYSSVYLTVDLKGNPADTDVRIYRATHSAADFVMIGTLPANQTMFPDYYGVVPGASYWYRAAAYNRSQIAADLSPVVSTVTPSAIGNDFIRGNVSYYGRQSGSLRVEVFNLMQRDDVWMSYADSFTFTAIASFDGFMLAGTDAGAVYKSADGQTWLAAGTVSGGVKSFVRSGSVYYVSTAKGVYSSASGTSWSSIYTASYGMGRLLAYDGKVYCGDGAKLVRITGSTPETVATSLPSGRAISSLAVFGGYLYAGTVQTASAYSEVQADVIFRAALGSLTVWSPALNAKVVGVYDMTVWNGRLYAASGDSGLVFSLDSAAGAWSKTAIGGVRIAQFGLFRGQLAAAAQKGAGVFISPEHGRWFSYAPGGMAGVNGLCEFADRMYAAGAGGKVYSRLARPLQVSVAPVQSQNSFYISGLSPDHVHYIRAFVDVTGDGILEPGEDSSAYTGPVSIGDELSLNVIASSSVPAVPGSPSASAANGVVTVQWTPAPLAFNLLGYRVFRSTVQAGPYTEISASESLGYVAWNRSSYIDSSAPNGTVYYRVKAVDWGYNESPAVISQPIAVSQPARIEGMLYSLLQSTFTQQHYVTVSTNSSPLSAAMYTIPLAAGNQFSAAQLPDGAYYVRAFADTNGNRSFDMGEALGAYGGIAYPYSIYVKYGVVSTGNDVTVCPVIPLTPGSDLSVSVSSVSDCAMRDYGSFRYGKLFSFEVGYGSGKVAPGSGIRLSAQGGSLGNAEIKLIDPSFNSNMSASGELYYYPQTLGVYYAEVAAPADYASGTMQVNLNIFSNSGGRLSGNVSYYGTSTGTAVFQVYRKNEYDSGNFYPIRTATAAVSAGVSPFYIYYIENGDFYITAYIDVNGDGVRENWEPYGFHGSSAPAAFTVSAGTASGLSVVLADPVLGSAAGNVAYYGSSSGNVRVEVIKYEENDSHDYVLYASTGIARSSEPVSSAYTLIGLPPSADYYIHAYVDANGNLEGDTLEPNEYIGPFTVYQGSATVVNVVIRDIGTGAAGAATITGTVTYAGAPVVSQLMLGFFTDPEARQMPYTAFIAPSEATNTWNFSRSGIAGGTTYYMGAVLDLNANGFDDPGEPKTMYMDNDGNGLPIYLSQDGSASVGMTLPALPDGTMSGVAHYYGTQIGKRLIVNIYKENCRGDNCSARYSMPIVSGQTDYPFTFSFLEDSTDYYLYTYIDVNENQSDDSGEPEYSSRPTQLTVSAQGASSPDFTVARSEDRWSNHIIRSIVSYSGAQRGNVYMRVYPYGGSASNVRTSAAVYYSSGIALSVSGLSSGTYTADVFMDTNGNGVYDAVFEPYAAVSRNASALLETTYINPVIYNASASMKDPGSESVSSGTLTVGGNIAVKSQAAGTLRTLLFRYSSDGELMRVPVLNGGIERTAGAGVSSYTFTALSSGNYLVQGFVDTNDNFQPDDGEPWGQSAASVPAVVYSSGVLQLNFTVADRTVLTAGGEFAYQLSSGTGNVQERPGSYAKLFSISAKAGDTLNASMTPVNGFSYGRLYLYGPYVNQTSTAATYNLLNVTYSNVQSGVAQLLSYRLPSDGVYTLAAVAYEEAASGGFKLKYLRSGAGTCSISGTIDYTGSRGGSVIVGIYGSSDVYGGVSPMLKNSLPMAGAFSFSGLPGGSNYYLGAFVDSNGNGVKDSGEDYGAYTISGSTVPMAVSVLNGQEVSGLRFTVNSSADAATVAQVNGTVYYGGSTAGNLRVEAWTNAKYTGIPSAVFNMPAPAYPQMFSMRVPGGSAYYFRAFVDAAPYGEFNASSEPAGAFAYGPVYLKQGDSVTLSSSIVVNNPGYDSSASAAAGEGFAALVTTAAYASTMHTSTINFVVGPSGMQAGGRISVALPTGLYAMLTTSTYMGNGVVTATVPAYGAGAVSVSASQSYAEVTVQSGMSLSSGTTVQIVISDVWLPCAVGDQSFSIGSSQNGALSPKALFSGQPVLRLLPGSAVRFSGKPVSASSQYNFSIPSGTDVPFVITGMDSCDNTAAVSALIDVEVFAQQQSTITWMFSGDDSVQFSTGAGFASVATVTFQTGMSSATLTVNASQPGTQKSMVFRSTAGMSSDMVYFTVLNGQPITNVGLSETPYGARASSMTLIPSVNAMSGMAYINFNLALANTYDGWRVAIASRPFMDGAMVNELWQFWGNGTPAPGKVVWNGRYSYNNSIVPAGWYYVKIEYNGFTDTSLNIYVQSPEVYGTVTDASVMPPLPVANAVINVFGANGGGYAKTAEDGSYSVPGLSTGSYRFEITAKGYVKSSTQTMIASDRTNLDFGLGKAAQLVIVPSLASGVNPYAADLGGGVNAYDGTQNYFTNIRLKGGTTAFVAADMWDSLTNQHVTSDRIVLDVTPGNYSVSANLDNYGNVWVESVDVPASGVMLNLPAFERRRNVGGTLTVTPSDNYRWVSVSATPDDGSKHWGWGSAEIREGVSTAAYHVYGIDAGSYTISAWGEGLPRVSTRVFVTADDMGGVDFDFTNVQNNVIRGTITVNVADVDVWNDMKVQHDGSFMEVRLTAWAPNSSGYASDIIRFKTSSISGLTATVPYELTGLDAGTEYQVYGELSPYGEEGSNTGEYVAVGGMPKSVFVSSDTGTGYLDMSFNAASGVILGTVYLPLGSSDFGNVTMSGVITQSENPYEIGQVMGEGKGEAAAVTYFPGFACFNGSAAVNGICEDGFNIASFMVTGMKTQSMDMVFTYKTTGFTRSYKVTVVNGSTSTAVVDMREDTYSLSGAIVNRIGSNNLNTNDKLVVNATVTVPSGYPVVTGTLPVEMVRRSASGFTATVDYDPGLVRVGYITQSGTYTITGLQEGVYTLRTRALKECATCSVAVAPVEKLVTLRKALYDTGLVVVDGVSMSTASVNIPLIDGWDVSGTISLAEGVQDARQFGLTLTNKRGEVVRSTTVAIGNIYTGAKANSTSYSFSRLPGDDFYTLSLADLAASTASVRYTAAPITFPSRKTAPSGLQSSLTGQNVEMVVGAMLYGKLLDVNSASIINITNAKLLAPSFTCFAQANPWVTGGYYVAPSSISVTNGTSVEYKPIEADGTFRIGPVMPGVTYDVQCKQTEWNAGYVLRGAQNYSPAIITSVKPAAGENRDLGILELKQGQSISGTVKTAAGVPVPNMLVKASPSSSDISMDVKTYTSQTGEFSLWVSTYVSRYYDITASPREYYDGASSGTVMYQEVKLRSADLQERTTFAFVLTPVLGAVAGRVTTADGGTLYYPFGAMAGYPAAAVFLQPYGVLPVNNPLGDIEVYTQSDGSFEIPGVSTGVYTLKVVSIGYGFASSTVNVTSTGTLSAGTFTLVRGAGAGGSILKADGSYPSIGEIGSVIAVSPDFSEYLFGTLNTDSQSRSVQSYSITGFSTGTLYSIALVSADGEDITFPVEGQVSFDADSSTDTKVADLTYAPGGVDCGAVVKRTSTDTYSLQFTCSRQLRSLTVADGQVAQMLSLSSITAAGTLIASPDGTGALTYGSITADRRGMAATYTLSRLDDTRFSVMMTAYFNTINPATGDYFSITKRFDFFTGIRSSTSRRISNLMGGTLTVESAEGEAESSDLGLKPGSLNDSSGTFVVDLSTTIVLQKFPTLDDVPVQTLHSAVSQDRFGTGKLPQELVEARRALAERRITVGFGMQAASTATYRPISAFYDIFLPAGISHLLRQSARLTLTYDPDSDPNQVNVWYYNPDTGRYQLESANRTIDTINNTIAVDVDHFSTFVVMETQPIHTSTTGYTGMNLTAYNFPNPFNLESKTKQVNSSPGSGAYTAGQNITTDGTIIRVAVPSSAASGSGHIKIYNMAGELVRKIGISGVAPGSYEYFVWDGRNDSGEKVASGVYIGEVKVDEQQTFFKMAVVKDSKYR